MDGFLNITKVVKEYNKESKTKFNLSQYLNTKGMLLFSDKVREEYNVEEVSFVTGRKAGRATMVHPLVYLDVVCLGLSKPLYQSSAGVKIAEEFLKFDFECYSKESVKGALFDITTDKYRFENISEELDRCLNEYSNSEKLMKLIYAFSKISKDALSAIKMAEDSISLSFENRN